MNKYTPFFALAGVIALTGCPGPIDSTDSTDPGGGTVDCDVEAQFPTDGPLSNGDYVDCAPYTGETQISYFPQPTCSGDTWNYTVELKGTADGVDLYVYDPGGTGADPNQYGDGPHPMTDGETEVNGWWDAFSLELDVVPFGESVDGESTIIGCEKNNGSSLIWGFDAQQVGGGGTADCLVIYEAQVTKDFLPNFYAHPSGSSLDGCDEFEGWTNP